ncbi:diaminopimelate epimerase [Gemmatimonadota bacterium]
MNRSFLKMAGSGNDFIVLDDRDDTLRNTTPERWVDLCTRRTGVGADGVLMLQPSENADFTMTYLNADGKEASMCGNGARCLAMAAAVEFGLGGEFTAESPAPEGWSLPAGAGSEPVWAVEFEAGDGLHHAIGWGRTVLTTIGDPAGMTNLDLDLTSGRLRGSLLDTGVPHFVTMVEDTAGVDIATIGPQIRYHPDVGPAGANADFINREPDIGGAWSIRTWERGVEDETLACGTGCAAAATILALSGIRSPVMLRTGGGLLKVHFNIDEEVVHGLWLEGEVTIVYRGSITDL